jgi:hypothetical protein
LTDRARADLAELGIDPALATPRRHPHAARAVVAVAAVAALAAGGIWGAGVLGGSAPASAATLKARVDQVEKVTRDGVEGYESTLTLTPVVQPALVEAAGAGQLADPAADGAADAPEGATTGRLTKVSGRAGDEGFTLTMLALDAAGDSALDGQPVTIKVFRPGEAGALGEAGAEQTIDYTVDDSGQLAPAGEGAASDIAQLVTMGYADGALTISVRPEAFTDGATITFTLPGADGEPGSTLTLGGDDGSYTVVGSVPDGELPPAGAEAGDLPDGATLSEDGESLSYSVEEEDCLVSSGEDGSKVVTGGEGCGSGVTVGGSEPGGSGN